MKAFFSNAHRAHSPGLWLFKGGIADAQEIPQRAEVLLQAACDAGHDMVELKAHDLAARELRAMHAVHDGDYLDFLRTSWARWSQLPGCSTEMIPNVNLGRHIRQRPQSIVGLAGYYQADGACPIGEGTWQGATASGHAPLAFLDISSDGFERIGTTLGALNLPTLLVQEGGYLSPHLGTNQQRALRGFEAAHGDSPCPP